MKRKFIKEAPIDYSDTSESKMNPELERSFASKKTPFEGNPSLPKGEGESSFEEMLASSSFKRVVNNVQKYTGIRNISQNSITPLTQTLMGAVHRLLKTESKNRKQLQQIAIELVYEEMNLDPSEIELNAQLVGMGEIELSGMEDASEDERMQIEEDLFEELSNLDLEVQKRRIVNAMSQGASVKAQYMYHLVKDKLDEVNPNLFNDYGVMMAINDSMYWLLPEKLIDLAGQQSSSAARVDTGYKENEEGVQIPYVNAVAINFPALVHELTKGVMEVYGYHSIPQDEKLAAATIHLADSLNQEKWDLRIGPAIWDTFREMMPDELYEDDKRYLEKYLIMKLYALPAEEFNNTMRLVLAKKPEGKIKLQELLREAVEEIARRHEEE